MIKTIIKTFEELTKGELYAILQLRSEVFVVEQDCVYQDIDGKDQKALQILGFINKELIAYARVFKPGDYFNEASIGRVVVKKSERGNGYAELIMKESIRAIHDKLKESSIRVSAQTYLKSFYNKLGFSQVGEEYLEDGIPHIAMLKN